MALLQKRKYQGTSTKENEDNNTELMTKLSEILKTQSEMAQALNNINIRLNTLEMKIEANTNANAQELAILKQIVQKNAKIPQTVEFPLKILEELVNMEQKIKDDLNKYVNVIKTIITPEGLLENFPKIIDQDIILLYNYDGMQNKKAFKDLKYLNMAIFEATKCEGTTSKEYSEHIRKCFKVHKASHFRKISYHKKNVSQP